MANFKELVQASPNYKYYTSLYDQLIDYLSGDNIPMPNFQFIGYSTHDDEIHRAYWEILQPKLHQWDEDDLRLLTFAFCSNANTRSYLDEPLIQHFFNEKIRQKYEWISSRSNVNLLVEYFLKAGVSESDFWAYVVRNTVRYYDGFVALTQWISDHLDSCHAANIPRIKIFFESYVKLLLDCRPDFLQSHLSDFLTPRSYNHDIVIHEGVVEVLLKADAGYYGPQLVEARKQTKNPRNYRWIQQRLAEYLPDQFQFDTLQAAYHYLDWLKNMLVDSTTQWYWRYVFAEEQVAQTSKWEVTVLYLFDRLLSDEEPNMARQYIGSWVSACPVVYAPLLKFVSERFGQESVPMLMTALKFNIDKLDFESRDYFNIFFKLLSQYDYSAYYPEIWALTRHKSKKMRELAAVTLAKLGETAIPEAQKLLNDKKADVRQTGSLILSLIRTDRAQHLLLNALEAERNDDARDLMLDSLTGMLPTPTTEAGVLEMVEKARQRGKLDLPALPFVAETALPALYWRESGNPLDVDTVRFLLYRQGRSKDIRPDTEARPLYALIDRDRSQPFANAILKAYFESGADAKYKGCLTVGALLGGPDATDLLKAKVNAWTEASRGKMAEYAVQALAMVGDNKALRAVEFIARKYKSKNKNVGAAAQEAFGIAAQTLGISPYDLADSIIPDFGFEGLFRSFEVDGETYRAFVGTDFKLAFLDEDNRHMKSLPKATSAALKDEFKEVGKEIRDIVKAQSGRLEQYLVTQRKWPVDRWQALFMGNPVMFTYAIRLIWGVFNADQTLVYSFQCLEDQTLVNEEGDEVEWPQDAQLGMVHPLSLTPEQIAHWTEQLADADLIPILPQLTRRVVTLPETARTLTKDRQFEGVEHGGFGFVSKMEKLGWYRGSVQDGGWIANYYKDFSDLGITALLSQQGNISVGYYDENAALGPVMFVRSGSVRFGNYVYDEPEKDTDERLILFGQVPPIVYSEVMADLSFFKENDQRKTTVNP